MRFIALSFMALLLLQGCSNIETIKGKTIEEVISKTERISNTSVLYEEEVEKGVLIFHVPQISGNESTKGSKLGIEFLEKKFNNWVMAYKGGAYSNGISQKLYHELFYLDDSMPGFYGEVKDFNIKMITIETNGLIEEAIIIEVLHNENAITIWYIILDGYEEPILINGYDEKGELLYHSEYNLNTFSSGTTEM